MKVAIIMGSTSDLSKVEPAISILKDYGVEVNVRCLSAHRAHLGLSSFIKETETDGTEVIITAAGMAAALSGVVASQTVLPVIGVPISGSTLDGMDALLSIVQMPSGIPVATVAINGSKNAAYLALQIMAIKHDDIKFATSAKNSDGEERYVLNNIYEDMRLLLHQSSFRCDSITEHVFVFGNDLTTEKDAINILNQELKEEIIDEVIKRLIEHVRL